MFGIPMKQKIYVCEDHFSHVRDSANNTDASALGRPPPQSSMTSDSCINNQDPRFFICHVHGNAGITRSEM